MVNKDNRRTREVPKDLVGKVSEFNDPIIVEGKKDKEALEKMGIKNEIIKLSGRSLYGLCTDLSRKYSEVIILMDYDSEGHRLTAKLTGFFQRLGTKVNLNLRREIFASVVVREVESLK